MILMNSYLHFKTVLTLSLEMERKPYSRSRKTKLVPREYIDSDDDDEKLALMQEQIEQAIASIKKPSILNRLSSEKPRSNEIEFNVKVEVEECIEEIPDEDEYDDLIIYNSNDAISNENSEAISIYNNDTTSNDNNYTICDNSDNFSEQIDKNDVKDIIKSASNHDDTNETCTEKNNDTMNIKIDSVVSLKEQNNDSSKQRVYLEIEDVELKNELAALELETTSEVDKTIEAHLKNFHNERPMYNEESFVEKIIQEKLKRWRVWFEDSPDVREAPVMYACYVCELGWWYYSKFFEHIKEHGLLQFRAEMVNDDCVFIAYQYRTKYRKKIVSVYGECPRCLKDDVLHQKETYVCDGCYKILPTCSLLAYHEVNCISYKSKISKIEGINTTTKCFCTICPFKHWSNDVLNRHMEKSHSVRADLITYWFVKRCPKCNMNINDLYTHYCAKKQLTDACAYCTRKFPSKLLLTIHLKSSKKYISPCKICDEVVKSTCMVAEHLITHTDNYTMMYRCRECKVPQYYYNEEILNDHVLEAHYTFKKFTKSPVEKVFVPKRLMKEKKPIPIDPPYAYESDNTQNSVHSNTNLDSDNVTDFFNEELGVRVMVIKNETVQNILNSTIDNIDMNETNDIKPIVKTEKEETNEEMEPEIEIKKEIDETEVVVKQELMDVEVESLIQDIDLDDNIDAVDLISPDAVEKLKLKYVSDDDYKDPKKKRKPQKPLSFHIKTLTSFSCTKCDRKMSTFQKYVKHFSKHGYGRKTCPVCLQKFNLPQYLLNHVYGHIKDSFVAVHSIKDSTPTTNTNYQCRKCRKKLSSKIFFKHWENHLELENNRILNTSFAVDMDDKPDLKRMLVILQGLNNSKTTTTKLKDHELKQCIRCHKKIDRRNDCKRHYIEYLLSDAYKDRHLHGYLKCQMCGAGFQKADAYKLHMREHASLPIYTCELCNKSFSDSSNFSKHRKLHNTSVFICDICSKKFNAKKYFLQHLKHHEVNKPIQCEQCDKVFHSKAAYNKHMRKSRFSCPACKIRFDALKDKWTHMWEVHKERKSEADCPICSKSFRKIHDVKQHLRNEHDDYVMKSDVYEKRKIVNAQRRLERAKNKVPKQSCSDDIDVEENIKLSVVAKNL